MAYTPNLDICHGKYSTKLADDNQRDHHHMLVEALQELHEICDKGGVKTTLGDKTVDVKFLPIYRW